MGKTRWLSSVTPAILLGLVIFASTLSAAEWKEQVLYSFQAFIEYNFLGENAIGTIGPTQYPFADVFAPEFAAGFIPLADFFPISSRTPAYSGDPRGSAARPKLLSELLHCD
jgi:hypothetical protein